jgi:hypothetical protein
MKERPILFSAPMVRAILAGKKTQTRRVVKPQPEFCGGAGEGSDAKCWGWMNEDRTGPKFLCVTDSRCPYGEPGDRLWVRETWNYQGASAVWENGGRRPHDELFVKYRADDAERTIHRKPDDKHGLPKQRPWRHGEDEDDYSDYLTRFWRKWTPAIFMPRDVSRITLEIVSVRVERLQDITEADALAEGIFFHKPDGIHHSGYRYDESSPCHPTAVNAYSWLWESINGPESWAANSWVWVIEFKRL